MGETNAPPEATSDDPAEQRTPGPRRPAADGPGEWALLCSVALGAALCVTAVLLHELSTLLSRVEGSQQAFGTRVFTGWHLPWQTDDFKAAGGAGGLWGDAKNT